jgi:hypothetical protein
MIGICLFWIRNPKLLGLPDLDPLVRSTDPDPSINKQKDQEKPVMGLLYDFLPLKNDVMYP